MHAKLGGHGTVLQYPWLIVSAKLWTYLG